MSFGRAARNIFQCIQIRFDDCAAINTHCTRVATASHATMDSAKYYAYSGRQVTTEYGSCGSWVSLAERPRRWNRGDRRNLSWVMPAEGRGYGNAYVFPISK